LSGGDFNCHSPDIAEGDDLPVFADLSCQRRIPFGQLRQGFADDFKLVLRCSPKHGFTLVILPRSAFQETGKRVGGVCWMS
jgi:hypothetical protein